MPASRAVQKKAMPAQTAEEVINDTKGVEYELVDLSTRRLIEDLLPNGTKYFHALLKKADFHSHSHPHPLQEDAAVISLTKGYAGLSQILGMSYDTTHMYTLISHALGLLYIEKRDKQMAIIIPLGKYRPPAELSEILRELKLRYNDRRPKVRRLIDKITEKIALIMPTEEEASEHYQDELMKRVQRGISAQGVADPDGQIAMSILAEITPLFSNNAHTPTAQSEQRIAEYLPKIYRRSKGTTKLSIRQESPQQENQDQAIAATKNLPGGMSSIELAPKSAARAATTTKTMTFKTVPGKFNSKIFPTASKSTRKQEKLPWCVADSLSQISLTTNKLKHLCRTSQSALMRICPSM